MSDEKRPERPQGHDLIFLSEFPMGLVSDRPGKESKNSIEFQVGDKKLVISSPDRYGLPTPVDIIIFLCLLEEAIQQGCPDRVEFCRYRLVQRLGWQCTKQRYDRIKLALHRLRATDYATTNHYPDPKSSKKCVSYQAFSLLIDFDLRETTEGEELSRVSWFRLSPRIQDLLVTKQIKRLDLQQYLDFRSAVTQSLYRYLHTRRMDGKPRYEEKLETLCFERLGLARSYIRPSDLKRILDTAHEELLEANFLREVNYERTADGAGWKVVYLFPPRAVGAALSEPPAPRPAPAAAKAPPAPRPAPKTEDPPLDPLAARLVEIGISPRVAAELAAARPDEVERQLSYWPFRAKLKNPAGALRQAIGEAWAAPPGFLAAQERQRMQESAKLRALEAVAKAAHEAELHAAREAAFAAWWAALDAQRQAEYTAAAKEALFAPGDTIRIHFERHPQSLFAALRPYLLERMATSGSW